MKIGIFTATYNEVKNIDQWIQEVRNVYPNAPVLIIDDSSSDGTTQKLRDYKKNDSFFQLIVRGKKLGLGSAHLVAFQWALESNLDLLVTMDADLSHDPAEMPKLVDVMRDCSYVVGTRYTKRGGISDYDFIRKFISRVANLTCRLLLASTVTEYTSSFRCFDKSALFTLLDNPPKDEGYGFFIETTEILLREGLVMKDVPIHFKVRSTGSSKIPKDQIFRSALLVMRLSLMRLRK